MQVINEQDPFRNRDAHSVKWLNRNQPGELNTRVTSLNKDIICINRLAIIKEFEFHGSRVMRTDCGHGLISINPDVGRFRRAEFGITKAEII